MSFKTFSRSHAGRISINFALLALLCLAVLVSLRFGSLRLGFGQILETLWCRSGDIPYQIIFNIRLPRILLGALVGGSLAVSGTILQGVMRNPLAAPGIVSTSVFAFINAWNDYMIAYTFMKDQSKYTLPVWLSSFSTPTMGTDFGGQMAASVTFSLPVVVFFMLIQRNIMKGVTTGAVK